MPAVSVIPVHEDLEVWRDAGVDIYRMRKFQRSNPKTPASTSVRW